jgi:hypothetical protein
MSMVLIPVIPAEVEIGRIQVQDQSGQKVSKMPPPISTNKLGMVACVCGPSYMGAIR